MRVSVGESIRTFYLAGRRGPLLAIYHPPSVEPHALGNILVAPPFGEEMNRCRAMVSMQARAFSRIGIGTLMLDPFGTGDSTGEFSDASWGLWRDDLGCGIAWLRQHAGGCRLLWGVRLGAIMASELAAQDPGIERLLFWQPVVEGKVFFTQFLRIRIAAELEQRGGIKTTEELRRMSAAGEIVEVSGYRISPQMAHDLDEIRLSSPSQTSSARISWCEVVPAADSSIPRVNSKAIDAYRAAGIHLDFEHVIGPSFWQVHERVVASDLLDRTTRMFDATLNRVGSSEKRTPPDERIADEAFDHGAEAEYPIAFSCERESLVGIVHRAKNGSQRGVIIVVAGGPQYRVGAHRQFVSLARKLAVRGYPVLRFDLRGMGDSSGEHLGFERSESDIRSAIDAFVAHQPEVDSIVLFGECESASGILFYAYRDARVKGIALVNPWVRTEGGRAGVIMKHYYVNRLLSSEFWRKIRAGRFDVVESLRSFTDTCRTYLRGRKARRQSRAARVDADISALPLPVKTAVGLSRFRGPVMILMSGRDYIAREFDEVINSSKAWEGLLDDPRISRRDLAEADHTFSRESWKRQASDWVCEWLRSW